MVEAKAGSKARIHSLEMRLSDAEGATKEAIRTKEEALRAR